MNKDQNSSNISWVFWIAGFLFTVGFTGLLSDPQFNMANWWEKILVGIVVYILWPLFLGSYLFENFK